MRPQAAHRLAMPLGFDHHPLVVLDQAVELRLLEGGDLDPPLLHRRRHGDGRLRPGQLGLQLGELPAELARVLGLRALEGLGHADRDGVQVDVGQRRWLPALLRGLGGCPAVERAASSEMDPLRVLELEKVGRQDPGVSVLDLGEGGEDLVALALVLEPAGDGLAILRRRGPEHDQGLDLGEDVLVDDGAPLADERDAEALEPAAADQPVERPDAARLLPEGLLRDVVVGLLEEDVEGIAVPAVEALGEVDQESELVPFAQR